MRKFYRYIIYRLYTYWQKKNRQKPSADNVIMALAAIHVCQLFGLGMIVSMIYHPFGKVFDFPKGVVMIFLFAFLFAHQYLFYNKKNWDSYILEFEHESIKERKLGTIKITVYFLFSLFLPTLIMPIIYNIKGW